MRNSWVIIVLALLSTPALAGPEVVEVKSKNGLSAWLVQAPAQPIIAVNLLFKNAGSTTDPKGKEGRASLASALLTEGAAKRDALAFNTVLEAHAISLNAGVDDDVLRVSMKHLSEDKVLAFSLLADALAAPRMDRDALEREREATIAGLKQASQQPGWLLARSSAEGTFPLHSYARPASGTEASLARISRSDVLDYARAHLTRDNMILSVAGDITPEELTALMDTHFSTLPEKFTGEAAVKDANLPTTGTTKHTPLSIPQTMVRMVLPGLKRDDPDFMAAHVMNYILGDGSLNSRLGEEIREKRGLAYSVGASLEPMDHAGLLSIEFATRNDQAEDAIAVAKQTLTEFVEQGISEHELADAKQYLNGSFIMRLDSNAEIAGLLTLMQRYNLGKDYLDRREALINAVSREEVQKVAERLILPERLLVFTVGGESKKGAANAEP